MTLLQYNCSYTPFTVCLNFQSIELTQQCACPCDTVCSIPLLLFGFTFLFHPDLLSSQFLLLTFIISLMTVYIGFSLATISYQSWGSQLAQSLPGRTRISASREAFTLIGIILASIIPHYLGFASLPLFFALLLGICATLLIYFTPLEAPQTSLDTEKLKHALQRMFKNRRFVYLLS